MVKTILTAALAWALLLSGQAAQAENKVGALGRISPKGGVTDLMGPQGDTVAEVLVKAGDVVAKGAPLATFASKRSRELEMELAVLAEKEAQEIEARSNLAQQAKVKVAEAEHELANLRFTSFEDIGGASLSAQQMAQRKADLTIRKINLQTALQDRERLKLENTLRLNKSREQVKLAQEKLDLATLRAPTGGTILEVAKSPGEVCGGGPFIRMADLAQMYVVGEIFEGDLLGLTPGQPVTITSNALRQPMKGKVETIGRIISHQSKIAKVWIRLDEAEPAARLINAEVNVSVAGPKK